MKLKISLANINRRIVLFAIYNVVYALYMAGFLPRIANLISLGVFSAVCCIDIIGKKSFKFVHELKIILFPILIMIIISFVKQVYYADYSIQRMANILYLILPAIDAFAIINSYKNEKELENYIMIMFARMVLLFVIQNYDKITINALQAITFSDSESSVFESSMAHELFFMIIVFKYLQRNKLAILSALLCMLCFKRLSFLLSIVVLIFYKRIPQNVEVKKWMVIFAKVFFIISPLFILWLISDTGSLWFSNTFGIDLNVFSTGRMFYINLVNHRMSYCAGYGATHEFLANVLRDNYVTSIHCDVVRIVWECTVVSLAVYVNNVINLARKHYVTFIIIVYCLIECVVSHFMEGMTSWLLIYIFIHMVDIQYRKNRSIGKDGNGRNEKTQTSYA